jgi:prepilin-type N-terminal cleavage/methylation domain-containing protein
MNNSEDGRQKTEDSLSCEALAKREGRLVHAKNRSGMTLVEVLLAVAILGIMAVAVVNALFYPRLLALSNIFKQQAILTGTDEMERVFSQSYGAISSRTTNPGDRYSVNGRKITNVVTSVTVLGSGSAAYKRITVSVNYPGGENPVVLETFRYNVN